MLIFQMPLLASLDCRCVHKRDVGLITVDCPVRYLSLKCQMDLLPKKGAGVTRYSYERRVNRA